MKKDGNGKMYEFWRAHQSRRNGLGPTPTELSKACGTPYQAAKEAVCRYRRGRAPVERAAGLSPKSGRNVHRLLHRALSDAVAWDYLVFNPAEHASLPRERRRGRAVPRPWSVEELGQWLRVARQDRFAAMWILAATTGMRRSELLGVRRDALDLDAGTITIDETLISVAGRAEESDGKTDAGVRTVSLDAFMVAALRLHLVMLDDERAAFGAAYAGGWLFVWEDGQRPHPDSVTDRFNRLVDRAGARRIRLLSRPGARFRCSTGPFPQAARRTRRAMTATASGRTASLAVFQATPSPSATRATVRCCTTMPSSAHRRPRRESLVRGSAARLVSWRHT